MNDSVQFLERADPARTVWFTDFDGVLYRGVFPRWTQGISNAEFGLAFCLRHIGRPLRFLRIARGLVSVARARRALNRQRRAGGCTLGEADERLIRLFVERVLGPGLPEHLRPAAHWAARFRDREAVAVLNDVLRGGGQVVILSKAFMPVLEAVAERIGAEAGVRPILRGVPLLAIGTPVIEAGGAHHDPADCGFRTASGCARPGRTGAAGRQGAPGPGAPTGSGVSETQGAPWPGAPTRTARLSIDEERAVLSARAKVEHARRLLREHPEWEFAVCAGDTGEDAPMFAAVREALGDDRVHGIAVRPRDAVIRAAADSAFTSWKEVRAAGLAPSVRERVKRIPGRF